MIVGQGSYIYYGRHTTYKSGDPSSQRHQAFNPMVELIATIVTYEATYVVPFSKLDPQIFYDKEIVSVTVTIRTYFRDPIFLATIFTYKGVPAAWTGTGDIMTFNFSTITNWDKDIWIQGHINDQGGTNHINFLFDGGQTVAYRWIVDGSDGVLYEEFDIEFCEFSVNTQAVDIDDGFDDGSFDDTGIDGGFSNWDGAYDADEVVLAKDCTITWNNAALTGIYAQRIEFEIVFPKNTTKVHSQLDPIAVSLGKREYNIKVDGILKDNSMLAEALLATGSKTAGTFKIQYGTTKYLQLTNTVLKNIEGFGIPAAGETLDVTYIYALSGVPVCTYYWTGNEPTDPSNHINHTDV